MNSRFAGDADVSVWIWLVLPVLFFLCVPLIAYLFSDIGGHFNISKTEVIHYSLSDFLLNNENGLVEQGTVIILVFGIFFGLKILKPASIVPSIFIKSWFCLLTLSCLYFAGEEISWGQHIFYWSTPDSLKLINDQYETNIHNISSWFDQKPRLLFLLWVLVAGIFVPVYFFFKNAAHENNNWGYWFWPPIIVLPTAIMSIGIKILEKFAEHFSVTTIADQIRLSELQELFLAYFLMLYLLISYKKITIK
jgi:hypothetical protein